MATKSESRFVQVSSRGQITLPAKVRATAGVKPGDPLAVSVEEGRIVLSPAVLMPVEHFTDERIAAFDKTADITPREIAEARRTWNQ